MTSHVVLLGPGMACDGEQLAFFIIFIIIITAAKDSEHLSSAKHRHILFILSPHGCLWGWAILSHFADGNTEMRWEAETGFSHQAFTLYRATWFYSCPRLPAARRAKSPGLRWQVTALTPGSSPLPEPSFLLQPSLHPPGQRQLGLFT